MTLSKKTRVSFGKNNETTHVKPLSVSNETRQEKRPHELKGMKKKILFTMVDLWKTYRAKTLRHSITTISGKELYRGSLNIPHQLLSSIWTHFNCFETVKRNTLLLRWIAKEFALTSLTSTILGTLLRYLLKIFFIKLNQLKTKTRVLTVGRVKKTQSKSCRSPKNEATQSSTVSWR